jgi:hypothetical protein
MRNLFDLPEFMTAKALNVRLFRGMRTNFFRDVEEDEDGNDFPTMFPKSSFAKPIRTTQDCLSARTIPAPAQVERWQLVPSRAVQLGNEEEEEEAHVGVRMYPSQLNPIVRVVTC